MIVKIHAPQYEILRNPIAKRKSDLAIYFRYGLKNTTRLPQCVVTSSQKNTATRQRFLRDIFRKVFVRRQYPFVSALLTIKLLD